MNNIITFNITGKPKAKERSRKGKYGWYNPQTDLMNIIKLQIKNQLPKEFKIVPKKIPVHVSFVFKFKPLKNDKINLGDYYIKKPDIDNAVKLYMDCMNKMIFYDDNQIVYQTALKRYGKEDQIEIEVMW